MYKLKIFFSNGGHLIHIKSGCESLCLTREEAMELLERLPSIIVEMPLVPLPVIHADPEPESYPKGPR